MDNLTEQSQSAKRCYTNAHIDSDCECQICAQNKNGVQQGGSTVGVALSCTFYNDFLVKGTAPAKKKTICAEMKINT